MATNWSKRTKPTTSWTNRTKPSPTSWSVRVKNDPYYDNAKFTYDDIRLQYDDVTFPRWTPRTKP